MSSSASKSTQAPVFPAQYAIQHRPSGEFFGGNGLRFWQRSGSALTDLNDAKDGRVKLYRTKGTAMSVAKSWPNGPESDLDVVEFSLMPVRAHKVA